MSVSVSGYSVSSMVLFGFFCFKLEPRFRTPHRSTARCSPVTMETSLASVLSSPPCPPPSIFLNLLHHSTVVMGMEGPFI